MSLRAGLSCQIPEKSRKSWAFKQRTAAQSMKHPVWRRIWKILAQNSRAFRANLAGNTTVTLGRVGFAAPLSMLPKEQMSLRQGRCPFGKLLAQGLLNGLVCRPITLLRPAEAEAGQHA